MCALVSRGSPSETRGLRRILRQSRPNGAIAMRSADDATVVPAISSGVTPAAFTSALHTDYELSRVVRWPALASHIRADVLALVATNCES